VIFNLVSIKMLFFISISPYLDGPFDIEMWRGDCNVVVKSVLSVTLSICLF